MTRFNHIVINKDSRTVEVGAGLTWTDVYAYLVPKGLNVVGGRINGVGIAGLTLGGGECHSRFWPIYRRSYELKRICVRQDILGKQTSMGSLWTPSRNSTLYRQMERKW
jgi:hypothetical protein